MASRGKGSELPIFVFVAVLIRDNRFCNDLWFRLRRIECCFVLQNKQNHRALSADRADTHLFVQLSGYRRVIAMDR
ncbi:hypothetical protein CY34DRAFT_807029 [Suillus luteus UH-Slu-Lm8-n1]|uniref:Uncharacterized protein n=1 Tax=Suillus luteus UH-Slu-Lm8-n1 TaxID=930992 RepID=A0A0C9ZS40_9AGAM|nr:hypothetical protein CY34DRAFT_807029 [Suillus luteus UH-Slu-Lm8-n1]